MAIAMSTAKDRVESVRAGDQGSQVDEDPFQIGSGEDDAVFRKPVETINHRVTL
jgi:hypothetical protein